MNKSDLVHRINEFSDVDEVSYAYDFLMYVVERLHEGFSPFDFANTYDSTLDMCLHGEEYPGEPPIPQKLLERSPLDWATYAMNFETIALHVLTPDYAAEAIVAYEKLL